MPRKGVSLPYPCMGTKAARVVKRARSKELVACWARVQQEPCSVVGCTSGPITLHHPHGGSMLDRGITRGRGQKTSDWLVIPLCVRHHVGDQGIDSGMSV